MLNIIEYEKLENQNICFEGKYLYIFILKPQFIYQQNIINLDDLCFKMRCTSLVKEFYPTPTILSNIIKELIKYNLIFINDYNENDNLEGKTFYLPLLSTINTMPEKPFTMHKGWRPSQTFASIGISYGISDLSFTTEELKSFISYWENRSEKRNQTAWEKAFIMRLLKFHKAQQPNTSCKTSDRTIKFAQQGSMQAQKPQY